MKKIRKTIKLGEKELILETGHVAQQASGAVIATYGETVVLATVVAQPILIDKGYFPLSVEYEEELYAGGRIKGSRWVKRKGRPIDEEILVARLIDRSIRPLFDPAYEKDVQVIVSVLSLDMENKADIVGAIAVSAALEVSSIPWYGPIGIVRVGRKDKKFILNPTTAEMESSDMDLVVSSTKDAIIMIEMGAKQILEKETLEGIEFAKKETEKLISFIQSFAKETGREKEKLITRALNAGVHKKVKELTQGKMSEMVSKMATKEVGYEAFNELKAAVVDTFEVEEKKDAALYFEEIFHQEIRNGLLKGKRPDGRKLDELRKLSAEVAVLPRTHGSGLFQRGQTQALTIATLGSVELEQLIETAEGETSKRYIHHYSMPPFSVGETGKVGSPNRREIGHGALAEKALEPVIPAKEVFPYTMRVVTQILSSNGSTSMASVCGSSLSLMDAGVPITAPVAGIAMGVVVESEKDFQVITDIVGVEDGGGDMDFKVAGTKEGITALQLDVKTLKLTASMLKKAFEQARKAREEILSVMLKAIDKPRENVSQYAPKIKLIKIDREKIGELIGPGGKTIKRISEQTGAEINVDDDGSVSISAVNVENLEAAVNAVEGLTKEIKPGEIYDGTVKRLLTFGAFVEILPGREGLVHVSDMSEEYVKDPADVLKEGQEVKVRVKEIDDFKRLNLSMLLDGDKPKGPSKGNYGSPSRHSSGDRGGRQFGGQRGRQQGGRKSGFRGDRDRDRDRDRSHGSQGGKGGPHFPASRLVDMDKKEDFNN
ncbi:polyribonucleotide nucleotidyltransferase [Candidatus Woesebacteria bacterium]|nr:MAG: polyribonucleotide nucleotidyltransferase [Candidatus Woesebacteria bacterium]